MKPRGSPLPLLSRCKVENDLRQDIPTWLLQDPFIIQHDIITFYIPAALLYKSILYIQTLAVYLLLQRSCTPQMKNVGTLR